MKKIIFYQSHFCQVGGVETMAYNWCWWMRNFFDITILYCSGDDKRLREMAKLVKLEKYDEGKEYQCDIFIRNSVWGIIPKNIKADRMIEMRHANYKWLLDKGLLDKQYADMGIKEIVGCGEFVSQMSREAMGDNPTTIKNILLPKKKTNKVLHLISCTRIDQYKGWNRMTQLMAMLRKAKIKFEWNIFTNSKQACGYEEVHFYNQRYDIWDYLADADYTILLSDSEGLPYTIQESLQYQVPCVVTDIGGCTELIQDGVNGYVVPLDMNFDVKKLLNIPKCKEYDNQSLEKWLNYLGYNGKIDKEKIIKESTEVKEIMVNVKALIKFKDMEANVERQIGDEFECEEARAKYLKDNNAVEILETIEEAPFEVNKEQAKEEVKQVVEEISKALGKNIEVVEVEEPTTPKKKKK